MQPSSKFKFFGPSAKVAVILSLVFTVVTGCEQGQQDDLQSYESSSDEDSFECEVSEVGGIPFPGDEEPPPALFCETVRLNGGGSAIYKFTGDTDKFFKDVNLEANGIVLIVPYSALDSDNTIRLSDEVIISQKQVSRASSDPSGTKYLLIVRVSDDNDPTGDRKVAQSPAQLTNDFFGKYNNNLATRYEACSGGKLIIKPAEGPRIVQGVLSIKAPTNICDMTYDDVSNYAFSQPDVNRLFETGSTAKVTHKAIVMPNDPCVNFKGAAAWGQVNRSISWYQSRSASFPAVHVHEVGHNLGMKHSGAADSSGVFREYADPTCYMGNKAVWDEEGSQMCFNAAKTYYFTWHEQYHQTIPSTFSGTTTVNLVGIDDVVRQRASSSDKLVIKIVSPSNRSDLYAMFQRAKGINAGIRDHQNKIVITEQNGKTVVSTHKAALGANDEYKIPWSAGKTLVFKNDGISYGSNSGVADRAKFTIRIIGGNVDEPEECQDRTQANGGKWYDSDGSAYNCDWYANKDTNCSSYGNRYENFGMTANEACCACGGGTTDDSPSFCGDGNRDSGEVCDDGADNGKAGKCNNNCTGYVIAARCDSWCATHKNSQGPTTWEQRCTWEACGACQACQ